MSTVIFQDNFTGTDGTALDSHTPDTGTSWTRLVGDAGTVMEIASNQLRSDGDLNKGVIYTADATYLSADYDVSCTLVSLVNQLTKANYLMVRIQDQENMYAVRLNKGTTVCQLYKKVAGTWSALGSLFDEPADGSVIKLEMIGTALKFYDDGVEVASATDTDISAAGKAGVAAGGGAELVNVTDDGSTSNIIDTLTVTDLGAAAGGQGLLLSDRRNMSIAGV